MSISPVDKRVLPPAPAFSAGVDTPSTLPVAQGANLSQLTDEASLSSLAPRLQAVLTEIVRPEDNVLDTLTRNVENLQEGFVEALYTTLAGAGVDMAEKITLRLDSSNNLAVAGPHAQKENVENAVSQNPALSSAFSEIAAQSELLRDITNISKVMSRQGGLEQYSRMSGSNGSTVYQMSLKGDMSHFYFGRPT